VAENVVVCAAHGEGGIGGLDAGCGVLVELLVGSVLVAVC